MRSTWLALTVAGVLLAATPAASSAEVLWDAGAETPDVLAGEWSGSTVNTARFQPVTSPVLVGWRALRIETRGEDQGPGMCAARCERAQIYGRRLHREGDEDWTAIGLYVPPSYPAATTGDPADFFQTSWQFYGPPNNGSPPLEFGISRDAATIEVHHNWWPGTDGAPPPDAPQRYDRLAAIPFARGVWQKFVWHVKWSSDDDTGFAELYHAPDGAPLRKVVFRNGGTRAYGATLLADNTEGLAGIAANYRRSGVLGATAVYFDAIRTATTFREAAAAFDAPPWQGPAGLAR